MLRNNLAKLMIDRGISATQMFNDTGIARSTISKISNNNTDKISLQTIDKMCNYLGVTPNDFFDFLPYEVKIHCGFDDFDSLELAQEAHESSPLDLNAEKAWLSISFYRKKELEYNFDYSFMYIGEFESGYPFDSGYIFYLKDITPSESNSSVDIFETIPVQFRNDILEEVKKTLSSFFNVSVNCEVINKFDPVAIDLIGGL
ncbi:helix-turn-helix domain-containing protein [Streptococcus sp. zg-JUN1979]|uniref:helix-turn-helix domain-containing protein n=1 Tax=Streptococcus sp. zg-JUN1979 TaxID=3391450 RepID=UPI0039A59445